MRILRLENVRKGLDLLDELRLVSDGDINARQRRLVRNEGQLEMVYNPVYNGMFRDEGGRRGILSSAPWPPQIPPQLRRRRSARPLKLRRAHLRSAHGNADIRPLKIDTESE